MTSPEVLDSSGIMGSGFLDESSVPAGWTKKVTPRKSGTPKRMDVIYVAPDGEQIKNKKQLEKYLKSHPGGPSSTDFDWSTGETPRRSARLSSKGRLSSDSTETEPVKKRSRRSSGDAKEVRSPGSSSTPSRRGRKSQTVAAIPGKEEEMQEAGEEKADSAIEENNVSSGPTAAETPVKKGENVDEDGGEDDAKGSTTTNEPKKAVSEMEAAVPPTNKLGSAEDPETIVVKVIAGEQVLVPENTTLADDTTDMVMKDAPLVEEAKVDTIDLVAGVSEVEDKSVAADPVGEVIKPAEGETSLKKEKLEVDDTVVTPTLQNLEEKAVDTQVGNHATKDEDSLKPKDHLESQGIHALIEEPLLCAVTKPEQSTDSLVPAAERVGVSI